MHSWLTTRCTPCRLTAAAATNERNAARRRDDATGVGGETAEDGTDMDTHKE